MYVWSACSSPDCPECRTVYCVTYCIISLSEILWTIHPRAFLWSMTKRNSKSSQDFYFFYFFIHISDTRTVQYTNMTIRCPNEGNRLCRKTFDIVLHMRKMSIPSALRQPSFYLCIYISTNETYLTAAHDCEHPPMPSPPPQGFLYDSDSIKLS